MKRMLNVVTLDESLIEDLTDMMHEQIQAGDELVVVIDQVTNIFAVGLKSDVEDVFRMNNYEHHSSDRIQ